MKLGSEPDYGETGSDLYDRVLVLNTLAFTSMILDEDTDSERVQELDDYSAFL